MSREHEYEIEIRWTGNRGQGTEGYRTYSRDHLIRGRDKPDIPGSSDPAFRGDGERYNPEELLVASLSACHMLWYLHLCANAGIVVTAYLDRATGRMEEDAAGAGRFTSVVLSPTVSIRSEGGRARALEIHEEAHRMCFVSRSVNFPVTVEAVIEIDGKGSVAEG